MKLEQKTEFCILILLKDKAPGMLMPPSVGDTVNESVVIQGHEIRFATVALAAETKEIRRQLIEVVEGT